MADDPRDAWRDQFTAFHFSQSNPEGAGQGSVPALLRRVADSIESLGEVQVLDITFSSSSTADEDDPTVTVYHSRPAREA